MQIRITGLVLGVLTALVLAAPVARAVDPVTAECLACHDALLATDSTVLTVCSAPDCDHPLGVNYVHLASTNLGLVSPSELDPLLQLAEGGAIGCGTCHVPYSSQNHATLSELRTDYPDIADPMLTVDNRESGLCLGCHLK